MSKFIIFTMLVFLIPILGVIIRIMVMNWLNEADKFFKLEMGDSMKNHKTEEINPIFEHFEKINPIFEHFEKINPLSHKIFKHLKKYGISNMVKKIMINNKNKTL